jgi:hypothetical protein
VVFFSPRFGGGEQVGDARDGLLHAEAVERAGGDGAALLVAVPVCPGVGRERLARHADDLLDLRPYFFANAKSRSSCAGTPITAPSP